MIDAPEKSLQQRVRVVARTLARHGLVQAWGHCSARIDDGHFLVCAARPMGRIQPGEDGVVVAIDAPLPAGVLGEVRIHQQIYQRRPDVGGVCRIMPPELMVLSTLGVVPAPRHGVGAFNAACRYWHDVRLLRDDERAAQLAQTLGDAPSLVMRGNGAVTAAASIELAACFAWCLEESARVERNVRALTGELAGASGRLTDEETLQRQVAGGAVFDRLWDYLASDDPEYSVIEFDPADVRWGTRA